MNTVYTIINTIMPFDFMQYEFMKNAFLAILIITPLLALIGVHIVNNKMAFFSDALGHSALTGIAIGSILGITNANISMCIFGAIFAIILNKIRRARILSSDTVISICSSFAVAIGLAILSKNGNFAKYSSYLIGDILSIKLGEIGLILLIFISVILFEIFTSNKMLAISINKTMAKSKNINVELIEDIFSIITALTIMLSIRWVGVLIINALLVIPVASARNISKNAKEYTMYSVIFSLVSGIVGLIVSYYQEISTGPTIVIMSSAIFFITYLMRRNVAK